MSIIYENEIKVNGVTSYKKAVKSACKDIAEDNGIFNNDGFYGFRDNSDIENELLDLIYIDVQAESYTRIYKYEDLTFNDIKLIPEPDNKYDKNAIKILIFDHHVGYVPKNQTRTLKKYLNNDKYYFKMIGRIVGGPYKTIDEYGDIITVTDLNIGFRINILVTDEPEDKQNTNYNEYEVCNTSLTKEHKREIQPIIPFKQQLQTIENKTIYNNIHKIKNINHNTTNYNETIIDKLINKWNDFTDKHYIIYLILKGIAWIFIIAFIFTIGLPLLIMGGITKLLYNGSKK